MPKIEYEIDGQSKSVLMRQPTGKEIRQVRQKLADAEKKVEKGENKVEALNKYMEYLDEISAKCANMKVDELLDLPNDVKEKFTSVVGVAAWGEMDFSKLFEKRAD